MDISVISMGATEVARLSADPSWGFAEVLAALREQMDAPELRAKFFHGGAELRPGLSLQDWR